LLLVAGSLGAQAIPAFPGAEGGGATAVGGRGGEVYYVTHTNDSGYGSLRDAIENRNFNNQGQVIPRTVLFKTGGTITLNSDIRIQQPYLTIAGQTAPGGGICVRGEQIRLWSHDVVFRFMRFRLGLKNGTTDWGGDSSQKGSPMNVSNGAQRIVWDHCSLSWGHDELVSVWGYPTQTNLSHLTWQNCIFSEPNNGHPTALIVGLDEDADALDERAISVHHNMFIHNGHRLPLVKCNDAEVINNIIYDWEGKATMSAGAIHLDMIGNKYQEGPLMSPSAPWYYHKELRARVRDTDLYDERYSNASYGVPENYRDPSFYIVGNVGPTTEADPDAEQWDMVCVTHQWNPRPASEGGSDLPDAWKRYAPIDRTTGEHAESVWFPVTIDSVHDLDDLLVPHAGASMRLAEDGTFVLNRDAVDQRLIDDYLNRTYLYNGQVRTDLMDETAFPYPALAAGTPYLDTDSDGMPDAWEIANGLNWNYAADRNDDEDGDGYTNLEEFLNGSLIGQLVLGDTNRDGVVDAADIDCLYDNLTGPGVPASGRYDLDDDGDADKADVTYLVEQVLETHFGDANLDGIVNEADLAYVADGWKQSMGLNLYTWATGDFSGSGDIYEADLALLANNWKLTSTAAVPEPIVWPAALLVMTIARRRRV
jgi:pectate lyase